MGDILQLYGPTGLQVFQTPGGGDNHIDPFFQRPDLVVITLAAADNEIAQLKTGR